MLVVSLGEGVVPHGDVKEPGTTTQVFVSQGGQVETSPADIQRHAVPSGMPEDADVVAGKSSGMRVKVVDAAGESCSGASLFNVDLDFPNAKVLGLEPVDIYKSSVRDLVLAHAQEMVCDVDGICHVQPKLGDSVLHAYFGLLEGKSALSYEQAIQGEEIRVVVRERTQTRIRLVTREGTPVEGGVAGLIVTIEGESPRVHLLRKVTDANGEFEIALASILKSLKSGDRRIERVALAPYFPGCLRKSVDVDPNSVELLYVLPMPACGALRLHLYKSGIPVDPSGVMLRERPDEALEVDDSPVPDPWMSASLSMLDEHAHFPFVAISQRGYQVLVSGQPTNVIVEGPSRVGSVEDRVLRLASDRVVIEGRLVCVDQRGQLPRTWSVVFGVGGRSCLMKIDKNGGFSFAAPVRIDGLSLAFWSSDGLYSTAAVQPLGTEIDGDILLGDISVSSCRRLATIDIRDDESGERIDKNLLDVRVSLEGRSGVRSRLRIRFEENGECVCFGVGDTGSSIVGEVQSSVFVGQQFTVPESGRHGLSLAHAGRVEVLCEKIERLARLVLRAESGAEFAGELVGRRWIWEGVPLGKYRVISTIEGQDADVGGVTVSHAVVAHLQIH